MVNDNKFNVDPKDIIAGDAKNKIAKKRKSTDLLPANVGFIKDTDSVKKFLGITVDQWMQKPQIKDDSGYIGQKSGLYYKPSEEFYINESSKDRTNYQLESTATSIDDANTVNFVSFYQDLTNHLKFNGAITNNHNRLYSQEYYSWAPPINIDMLANFSNYDWLITGPTLITITNATNAVLDIIGKQTYSVGSLSFKSGMRIVLANDANAEYTNKSFIVEGVGQSIKLVDDTGFDGFGLYDTLPYDTVD